MEPCERSLDDPAEGTQSAPVCSSSFRGMRLDTARAELLPMWFRVVSAVRIDLIRSMSWAAAFAAYSRNRVHQWHQLRDIMGVRASQDRREGDPIRVGDQMMLAARLSPIRRIRPGFFPHLQPLGWRHCLRWHVTSQSCRPRATSRAGLHGASPIHLLVASRADVASRSSRSRIPSLVAASPKGSRSSTRRECPRAPFGSRLVSDRDTDTSVASVAEGAARSVPIARRSRGVAPCGTP